MVLANAGILLGSRRLLTRFGTGAPAADAALFLMFRLMLISAGVLVAGACHALRPWVLGLAGAGAAGYLIVRGTHREFLPLWKISNSPAVYLAGALAVRLLFHVWTLSPFQGDVTSYHLPKVAEWVIHGTLFTDLGPDRRSWFPAGFELVETWWVVFLHHDVLIEMAGVEFLALGAASAASIASSLGLGSRACLLAGVIYATVPGIMVESVIAINDPAAAALVVTTAALILERTPPAMLLAVAGCGAGVKPTYLFALPGLALLWLWTSKAPMRRTPRPDRALWAVAALGIAIGSVWYVRNTVVFGNPVYPAGTSALAYGDRTVLKKVGPSLEYLTRNLSDLDRRILDQRKAINGMLEHIAGWGVVVVAFGTIGLLGACRTSKECRALAACFALSTISVLSLVENDPFVLRYILFVPAILAVGAAWLATEIRILMPPLVLLTILTLFGTLFTEDLPLAAFLKVTKSDWRERSLASTFIPEVPYRRVGCYGDVSSMSYLLYGPDLSRQVVYLRPSSAADLLDSMKRHDLEALYAMTMFDRNGWSVLLNECVKSGRLRHLEGPWYLLVPD
jgi:hypothetical protein